MAERTTTLRLRAIISDFQKAMRQASTDANTTAKSVGSSFAQANKELGKLGSDLTRKVTVPLVATGVGALKLSTDFERSFAQMTGLAGVASDEVDGLRASVLKLSHQTAVGPQQLAEALYFVRSSGIDAAHAMGVVEVAAKASAAGLGSTAVIADAVTSAMNAYGAANLSAQQATDVLTAAVREGKTEASALAPVLGILIPTAAAMGIGFDQVAGTLAVMSRTGLDASEAATSLNAIFSTLLGTSKEGAQLLEEHGLSLAQLRNVAAGPGGVIEVMRLLDKTFAGNDEALSTIIPNIRAFRGVMNVLAQDAGSVDQVMRNVANSAGAADDAFSKQTPTSAFKLRQAWADLQVTLIKVGDIVAPIAAMFSHGLMVVVSEFNRLPPVMKDIVVGLALIIAAAGPTMKALSVIGDVAAPAINLVIRRLVALRAELIASQLAGNSYTQSLASMAGGMAQTAAAIGPLVLLVAGVAMTLQLNSEIARKNAERQKHLADAIKETGSAFAGLDKELTGAVESNQILAKAFTAAGVTTAQVADAVTAGGSAWDDMRGRLLAAGQAAGLTGLDFLTLQAIVNALPNDLNKANGLIDSSANTFHGAGLSASTFGSELDGLANPLNKAGLAASTFGSDIKRTGADVAQFWTAFPPGETVVANAAAALAALDAEAKISANSIARLSGIMDALFGAAFDVGDAQQGFADSLTDVDSAAKSSGGSTVDLTSKQRSLEKATKDVTKAQQDLADAEKALADARKGPTAREKSDAALDVREAQLGVKEAQRAVTDARNKLKEERSKGRAGDVAGAQLDLESANIRLKRAQDRVTDAQAAQNDVLHSGDETSQKVTGALKDVQAAQEHLTDATQAQTDAEAELAKGGGGGAVADHARAIRGAYDAMTTAGESWIKKLIEQKKPTGEIVTALDNQAISVQAVIDKYGDANGKLHEYLDWLNKIKLLLLDDTFYTRFNVAAQAAGGKSGNPIPNFLGSDASGNLPGKAVGGPASPDTTYWMGENGPEVLHLGATSPPDKLGKRAASDAMSGRSALGGRAVVVGVDGPQLVTMGSEPGWVTPNHELRDVDGRRATGGPVLPGRTYLVGEAGPEVLTIGGISPRRTAGEVTQQSVARYVTHGDVVVPVYTNGEAQRGAATTQLPGVTDGPYRMTEHGPEYLVATNRDLPGSTRDLPAMPAPSAATPAGAPGARGSAGGPGGRSSTSSMLATATRTATSPTSAMSKATTYVVGVNGPEVITMGSQPGWVHSTAQLLEGRAAGGPVRPGQTVIVGELGPELLTIGGQTPAQRSTSHTSSIASDSSSLIDRSSIASTAQLTDHSSRETMIDRQRVSSSSSTALAPIGSGMREPLMPWSGQLSPAAAGGTISLGELTVHVEVEGDVVKSTNKLIRYSKQAGGLPIRIVRDF